MGAPGTPLAFAAVEGCSGYEWRGGGRGGGEAIDVDADPPPREGSPVGSTRRSGKGGGLDSSHESAEEGTEDVTGARPAFVDWHPSQGPWHPNPRD